MKTKYDDVEFCKRFKTNYLIPDLPGALPCITVHGETIAETWLNSMVALGRYGKDVPTAFDRPGDPPGKDAHMTLVIENPLAEPMITKIMPAGLDDLEVYRLQRTHGI